MITLNAHFPQNREDKTFRSYGELLRWIVANNSRHGHRSTPEDFYLGSGQAHSFGYSLYSINQTLFYWKITAEDFRTLMAVQLRYRGFLRYLREVRPEWRELEGGRTYWMDNSVDITEVDKDGNRRTRQITAPHGDLC